MVGGPFVIRSRPRTRKYHVRVRHARIRGVSFYCIATTRVSLSLSLSLSPPSFPLALVYELILLDFYDITYPHLAPARSL